MRGLLLSLVVTACVGGPPPDQVRLELPELVATTDPARAVVHARYASRGSVTSPGPNDFSVVPPEVASVSSDGAVVCKKTGDAKVTVTVQGVRDDEVLRCRLVDLIELNELPLLDVRRGPIAISVRALGKDKKELSDVPVVVSSERPSIARVSGLTLTPVAVGETKLIARAGNAERRFGARVVRTLDVEALPLDGGHRIYMSLTDGKYELSVTLRRDHALSVEWRGAPYCAYRSTGRLHRSSCVLQGKGGVVFDNPAFLESGSTEVSKEGVVLSEVP